VGVPSPRIGKITVINVNPMGNYRGRKKEKRQMSKKHFNALAEVMKDTNHTSDTEGETDNGTNQE
jgi:hypothetical protein